jgi:hypothetical protein
VRIILGRVVWRGTDPGTSGLGLGEKGVERCGRFVVVVVDADVGIVGRAGRSRRRRSVAAARVVVLARVVAAVAVVSEARVEAH